MIIENPHLRVRLLPPDGDTPFYAAQRFNHGGIVASVETGGRIFFGPWKPNLRRGRHDSITGPADEFDMDDPPGYADAAPGGAFVKIGVGALERTGGGPYAFGNKYPVVDAGIWRTEARGDAAVFTHTLRTELGYDYELTKTVALAPGAPAFTLTYTLKNTGTRPLRSLQYHHNFCVFDGVESVGPDWDVSFGYAPERREPTALKGAALDGDRLRITEELAGGRSIWMSLSGTDDPARHRIRVAHAPTGRAFEIEGSEPIVKLNVWSQHRTLCPEPFVEIALEPGAAKTWSATYRFVAPEN